MLRVFTDNAALEVLRDNEWKWLTVKLQRGTLQLVAEGQLLIHSSPHVDTGKYYEVRPLVAEDEVHIYFMAKRICNVTLDDNDGVVVHLKE